MRLRGALVALFLVGAAPAAHAHPAWGIVVDARGVVYFADVGKNCIWRAEASGGVSRFMSGKHSHALYLDSAGNLVGEQVTYEAARNLWWTSVWKATPDGIVTEVVPPRSDFGGPSALEVSSGRKEIGSLVRKVNDSHRLVRAFALSSDGASLLSTLPDTVQRLTVNGLVQTLGRAGEFDSLFGVTEDHDGSVYVAEYGRHRVLRIARNGQIDTAVRLPWPWVPTGVAVARGDLYVLELRPPGIWTPRVRRVARDGSSRVIAEP